ncbi:BRO-N domain-containing protein [Pseudomonas tohonis]|jgi:prophage antirepressor-like protein|uniref:BRO-N domain-containing protein n=1 Tax=Pseudomonas tohonis TaxID=2725477 RepID=UPI001F22D73C|nr:BRO family protein [Pseudomonas tohonis]
MHDALTPTFFHRHGRPLRGVMIDDQPWFCAYDFARLLGLHHPQALHRRLRPYQVRKARFAYATGSEEEVQLVSEGGLYQAMLRFGHPELRHLEEWLARDVIPTLRDQYISTRQQPRRVMLDWQSRRLVLLDWQGELWMQWEKVPRYRGL